MVKAPQKGKGADRGVQEWGPWPGGLSGHPRPSPKGLICAYRSVGWKLACWGMGYT